MKKHLFLILRFVVSFGLIGYIFYQIGSKHDLSELPAYYSGARYYWLAGAVVLMLALLAAGSVRWGILLRAQGVELSPASVFMYYMIGMFFNNFLPSTVGGDVVKVYYLAKFTGKGASAFVSVVMDRIMGMAGLCVVALFTLLLGCRNISSTVGRDNAVLISLIVVGLSVALIIFFVVVFSEKAMRFLLGLIPWKAVREKIRSVHDAVFLYRGKGKVLLQALLISIAVWVVIMFVCWMIYKVFQADHLPPPPGKIVPIPLKYFFLFLPTISVIMSLPISFAGLGTREAFFILFFQSVPGVREIDALMLSLNFYFVSLLASLVGGIIYILKDQLRFHREEVAGIGNETGG